MLDNGFPLATESNILKELIKPPNILRTIANTVTGKSKYIPKILITKYFPLYCYEVGILNGFELLYLY